MAKFSNFDTDFYGMKQFKKLMESQGVVEVEDIRAFLKESVEQFADDKGDGEADYLDFNNGLALVVAYEPGFDSDDPDLLVDSEGYALCVSIRETGSAHMIQNWVKISKEKELKQSDADNDYEDISEFLMSIVKNVQPEEKFDDTVDREETEFDSMEDFAESFETWKKAINEDGTITVEDCNLGKVMENNRVNNAVIFTLKEEITDGDSASLDEYLTSLMPESIQNFCENQKFDFVVTGMHDVAFVALKD